MEFDLESELGDFSKIFEKRKIVYSEFNRLGEKAIEALIKKLATEKTPSSIQKLINLFWLLGGSRIYDDFAFSPNSRLEMVTSTNSLFGLNTVFHIPTEDFMDSASGACDIVLEYLESDVETVRDLASYAKWCELDESVEERLRQDPRYTVNFELYERGLGN